VKLPGFGPLCTDMFGLTASVNAVNFGVKPCRANFHPQTDGLADLRA
jgi:hypothetical protein